MNLINTFAVSYLAAALAVPAASAADKEVFCQNLTNLESHIIGGSMALNNTNNLILTSTTSTCACSELDVNDKSFTIDCSVEEQYSGTTFVTFEQMLFGLNQGEYSLSETSWGKEYDSFGTTKKINVKREVFYLDDGVITSCEANACTSCSVCDDKKSIAKDCSHDGLWTFADECSKGYTGAFVNTFDFGSITGEEVEEESPPDSTTNNSGDRGAFCQSFTDLESHMTESFEKKMRKTYTSSFGCACSELDMNKESFTVDCSMEGVDGHMTFASSEQMVFELNQGKYELSKTSWREEDSDGIDDQEVFNLENGVVTSCEANGCMSCSVCDDQQFIAVNCSNLEIGFYTYECSGGYTGSSSNTFDFGEFTGTASESTDATTTAQATDATATDTSATTGPASVAEDDSQDEGQLDPGSAQTVYASNDALSLNKMGWMASSAFVCIATGFLTLMV